MKTCEAPNTLLGFLLQRDRSRYGACSAEELPRLFRDYVVSEINALLWIFLIVVTALLLRKVNMLLRLWSKGLKIPGPPCPSFYGHLKLFCGAESSQSLMDFLGKSHEKYGSVVRLWLGPTQLLVSIKDPTLIKEMLLKAEDKLPLTARVFRLAFGRSSLFLSSFEKVQRRRDSLATELNGKLLERANLIPSKVLDCVMERINNTMDKGVVDCKSVSEHMAFSILGATLFGDTFLAWSKANDYEELLMMIAKDACFWASYSFPPFWKRGFWRYQRLCTKLKFLTKDIMQQCRQSYKSLGRVDLNPQNRSSNLGKDARTSGGVMADSLPLEELNGHFNTREVPFGNIMGMMFHGCLTTAGLIDNILSRLVMHPDIQDKIHSEVVMVRQRSKKQEQQDVSQMHFLLATVYESARLLPAGPLLQRCSLKHDLNLKNGITLPAGAILVVPVQLVQTDNSSWGNDASQFNPCRFLSTTVKKSYPLSDKPFTEFEKELIDAEHSPFILNDPNANAAFLPFGAGTRVCVGQKFVILGVATLIASLLECYEVRLRPGSQSDPKPGMNNCVLHLFPSPKIFFFRRNQKEE